MRVVFFMTSRDLRGMGAASAKLGAVLPVRPCAEIRVGKHGDLAIESLGRELGWQQRRFFDSFAGSIDREAIPVRVLKKRIPRNGHETLTVIARAAQFDDAISDAI